MKDFAESSEDDLVFVGKCEQCNSYFFCSNLGSYHCRKCKTHNGDHDLKFELNKFADFSDLNSIKKGLEEYGTSI